MFRQDKTSLPSQKKSTRDKNKDDKQWYKDNIDAYENQAISHNNDLHQKMDVYEDLDNDIVDQDEIEKVFNPMGLETNSFPANIKNYPLSVPKIDLLQGEEVKRRFDWTIRARNLDGTTNEQDQLMQMFMQVAIDELSNEAFSEEEAQKRVQEFSKYAKYTWKDANELTATKILQYLWRQQDMQDKFNRGYRKALVQGREIYRIDVEGEEPKLTHCDPRNIYPVRMGSSERIEDAEAIVEISYEPIGAIIDSFYDYLTPSQIDQLENQTNSTRGKTNGNSGGVLNYDNKYPQIYSNIDFGNGPGFLSLDEMPNYSSEVGLPYDAEGNVRVVRARWRGRRKVGRLTFFDDNGDEQEKIVSEYYKPDKFLGETVKWFWVNEAEEGTKIGEDIYLKMQPREIQMRHFDNKSKCFLGYVGTDYGKSLMGRMEPYQYAYNIYMSKLELVMAKYKGPIYELDLNKVPDGWELDQWFYYADMMGWAVLDNFNEGKKGSATGKLAGNFNTTGKVMESRIGDYIQQIVVMLQHIERQMGQIVGVNDQRQGQVDNRETVGGVERAVTQSSHITERLFFVHDETKKRVMNALLDTAKYAWKKVNSKKLTFVLDDLSRQFLEFNGDEFASTEYDLFTTTSSKDMEIRETLKQLAHAAAQNGAGLGLVVDVLRSDSITEMTRRIETAEEEAFQRQNEASKRSDEVNQQIAAMQEESKEKDRQLKIYEIDKKAEIEYAKLGVQQEQASVPEVNDDGKDQLAEKKHNDDHQIKRDQLNETIRHNKETEKISKIKPKQSNK